VAGAGLALAASAIMQTPRGAGASYRECASGRSMRFDRKAPGLYPD